MYMSRCFVTFHFSSIPDIVHQLLHSKMTALHNACLVLLLLLSICRGQEDTRRRTTTSRRIADKIEVEEGMANLQQMFRQANGRDFTQQELNEALERAHSKAGDRGSEHFPTNRHLLMVDVPDDVRSRHLEEHNAHQQYMEGRRMQTVRKDSGFMVTADSPGFLWNSGRNAFYCVAVPVVADNQRNTKRRQKMTLKNCYASPADELVMRYTDENELWMEEIDTVFYDWCLETAKARQNKPVRLNLCDVYDENQVFDLIGVDNTWRSAVDDSLCVTCQKHNCATGGGKLKYKPCSSDISGNNQYRPGQAFIYCYLGTSCTYDATINRIDCLIDERCGEK